MSTNKHIDCTGTCSAAAQVSLLIAEVTGRYALTHWLSCASAGIKCRVQECAVKNVRVAILSRLLALRRHATCCDVASAPT